MELHDGVPVEANARKSSATAKLEETSKLICLYKEALNNFKDKPKLVLPLLEELGDIKEMTFDMLKSTSIGKTVNGFRKQDGRIGEFARDLVSKWKLITSEALSHKQSDVSKTVDSSSINQQLAHHYNGEPKAIKLEDVAKKESVSGKEVKSIKQEKPSTPVDDASNKKCSLNSYDDLLKTSSPTVKLEKDDASSFGNALVAPNGQESAKKSKHKKKKHETKEKQDSKKSSSGSAEVSPNAGDELKESKPANSHKDGSNPSPSFSSQSVSSKLSQSGSLAVSSPVDSKSFLKTIKQEKGSPESAAAQNKVAKSFADAVDELPEDSSQSSSNSKHKSKKHKKERSHSRHRTPEKSSSNDESSRKMSHSHKSTSSTGKHVEKESNSKSDEIKPKKTLNLADYKILKANHSSAGEQTPSPKEPLPTDSDPKQLQSHLSLLIEMAKKQITGGVNSSQPSSDKSSTDATSSYDKNTSEKHSRESGSSEALKLPKSYSDNVNILSSDKKPSEKSLSKESSRKRDDSRRRDNSHSQEHSSHREENRHKDESSRSTDSKTRDLNKSAKSEKDYSKHQSSKRDRDCDKSSSSRKDKYSGDRDSSKDASLKYDKGSSSKSDKDSHKKSSSQNDDRSLSKHTSDSGNASSAKGDKHSSRIKSSKRDKDYDKSSSSKSDRESHKSRSHKEGMSRSKDQSDKPKADRHRSRSPLQKKDNSQSSSSNHKLIRDSKKRKLSDSDDGGCDGNGGLSFDEVMSSIPYPVQTKKKRMTPTEELTKSTLSKTPAPLSFGLPELVVDYKPSPKIACGFDEKSNASASNRGLEFSDIKAGSRTEAMYSGKRKGIQMLPCDNGCVPSLKQQCIAFLCNNIDDIGELGNAPYMLVEPIFTKASPKQLHKLEEYNPDFLDDNKSLWEKHCRREFKDCGTPGKSESWKDLYWRKCNEREKKLEMLQSKIAAREQQKQSEARKSMVAYTMSSAPKPPRDVRRKQARYGTGTGSVESTARAAAIIQHENSTRSSTSSKSSSSGVRSITMAPLMKMTKKFMNHLPR